MKTTWNLFSMSNIDSIIAQLEAYDEAYHNGDPIVPDVQYDTLKAEALKKQPSHPYFIKVGSDTRGGKIKLPFAMGSLDQIYEGDYPKWVKKFSLNNEQIAVSHKLDGVSCMLQYKNGELQIAYSRGDGFMGADYTRHVKKLASVPKTISKKGHLTIRGELIMDNVKFQDNWSDTYANARNLVAGIFNRSKSDETALADVDFIAYQIVDCDPNDYRPVHDKQSTDMLMLESLGFKVVCTHLKLGKDLDDDTLTEILRRSRLSSDYELDGIVLTINDKASQKNLSNSSSINPEHSVKYKVLDKNSNVETTVVKVHNEISKNGYFKPRVEILPVQLFGTTVTFATGFNGRYIVDNQIGPGTKLKITKSGSVIPYITEILQSTYAELPSEPWEWNENKVEMVVKNAHSHPEVIFKQVLDFFNTLDIDLLKEASITKVISVLGLNGQPYETIIQTMLSLIEMEWLKIIGSNGGKIYNSLERRLNALPLATYLGAVKYFGHGFGVRKAKMLLKNLADENDIWNITESEIINFEGFDVKTARNFVNGMTQAKDLADILNLKFVQETKTDELAAFNVVFTGFRDKDFQTKLEKAGAKVGSSVSKKTTHLITAEPNSNSTKAAKAREIGIETLSLEEFKDKYNL